MYRYAEDGQLWVQYVSSTPATRLDVINLQERLDQQLQQRQGVLRSLTPGGCHSIGHVNRIPAVIKMNRAFYHTPPY